MSTGSVKITLGEDGNGRPAEVTLQPTLRVAYAIDELGGFPEAFRQLTALKISAYVAIIGAGLGKKPQELADLAEMVFKAGMPSLIDQVSVFVGNVARGGKPADPDPKEKQSGEA